ncbi:MAG: hypothetical protein ACJ8CR_03880 [Roseiflexaceae bacterium]
MSRKPLFKLLGVPVIPRPDLLLAAPLSSTLAYAVARRRAHGRFDALVVGIAAALLWYKAEMVHVAGHILSSRACDAPMDFVSWGILAGNGYENHDVTPQQHIGRSIGGPIASGLAVIFYWLLWRRLKGRLPRAIAAAGFGYNALIAVGSMAPVPMVDGGVIYANMRKPPSSDEFDS